MLQDFLKFIEREQLFDSSQRILLAVSGGLDSVVMAHLFYKAGFSIAIAHCNFALREKDSDTDQEFVADMAKEWDLPFYTIKFDTKDYARQAHISIQMAARDLRFAYFDELLKFHAFDYYATAHHQDDDAETFFINICRGTGIKGMRGILPKNGKLLHPLLFASRHQIETYAKQEGLKHREDSSNASDKYLRNKIRHHILPQCKELHPAFVTHLQESMQRLSQCRDVVEEWYRQHVSALTVQKEKDIVEISVDSLCKIPQYALFLYEYLSRFGFSTSQIGQITLHLQKEQSGKYYDSSTHRLLKNRGRLLLQKKEIREDNIRISCTVLDRTSLESLQTPPHIAYFDKASIKEEVYVRKWQAGDYFYPLGMKNKQKLQDYFSNHKFSLYDKENTYLLCSGNDILWIMGHRIDNRFRVKKDTEEVLCVEYIY